jgi:uncharacterized Zn finger protein
MTGVSWTYTRAYILRRDNYTCQTCSKDADDVHHIIPKRLGGLDILNNLTSLCNDCHRLLDFKKYIISGMSILDMSASEGNTSEVSTVTVTAFRCNRCGHIWLNKERSSKPPRSCAACKSPYWNSIA